MAKEKETKATKVKKETKKVAKTTKKEKKVHPLDWVIKNPRVTEKAAQLGMQNVYTFDVSPRANKVMVREIIKAKYDVSPVKVNMATIPKKAIPARGRRRAGTKGGGKKALVFLKKGDIINF